MCTRAPEPRGQRVQHEGSTGAARRQHGGSTEAARRQHGGSTGVAKCLFHEVDFQAISIYINILNANEI